ncbi:MAG: hypothetical protein ABIO43_12600 [Sphingomicrobium sp.]
MFSPLAACAQRRRIASRGAGASGRRIAGDKDRYGRDLRALRRVRADRSVQSIADDMRSSGVARRYLGGFRSGWCGEAAERSEAIAKQSLAARRASEARPAGGKADPFDVTDLLRDGCS